MILHTPRLTLRPIELSDTDPLLAIFQAPEVRRFLLDDELVSRPWVIEEITASTRRFGASGAGLWAIRFHRGADLLGFVGFREFYQPPRLQLLYGLLPQYWKQGLATEAARRVCDHGFSQLGFERIEAATDAPNQPSIAVLLRLGMTPLEPCGPADDSSLHFALQRSGKA